MQYYQKNAVLTYAFYDKEMRNKMRQVLPVERVQCFSDPDIMQQLQEYECICEHLYRSELLQLFGVFSDKEEDCITLLSERVHAFLKELQQSNKTDVNLKIEMVSFHNLFWFHEWIQRCFGDENNNMTDEFKKLQDMLLL